MVNPNPYLAPQTPSSPRGLPVASHSPHDDATREKIFAVAKYQRLLNLIFLLMIAFVMAGGALMDKSKPEGEMNVFTALFGITYLSIMYPVNKLAHLLRKENPALMTFGVITFVGLIIVFIYNSRVTNYLKQFGIKVGILGASRASIERQLDGRG